MTTTSEQPTTETGYTGASTERVTAENGIEYAYRDLGESEVPLVLLQHFRGNLDNWDPALIDDACRGATRHHLRQRRRRRHDRHDAEHRRGDGARRDRLPRGDGASARRPARLLDRQLRRAGDRAHPPRPAAACRARILGTAGRSGDARLGAGGDRRGRCAGDDSAGIHLTSSSRPPTRAAKRASRPPDASSAEGRPTETNRRRGRPARRSTTPSARGGSRTTRCSSESPRSTSRCSSPTATATR